MEPEEIEPNPEDPPNRASTIVEAVLVGLVNAVPIVLLILSIGWGTHYASNHWHVSLWLAVPFGLLVGLVFAGFAMIGNGTLFEAGVRCTIILVLVLILAPIYASAKHKADIAKQKAAAAARRMP